MTRILAIVSLLAAALLPAPASAAVKVVTTVTDLAAIAKEVGGDHVTVKSLSLATQDPHFVDAKPSLALDLNRADLLLVLGADMEIGWLPALLTGARNPAIQKGGRGYLDCAGLVQLLDVPAVAVDRSMGDIHPVGNPHYLTDPRRTVLVADGIAAKLAEIDPKNADAYEAGAKAFNEKLEAARKSWEERLAPYRGAPVLCYHKTWTYVAEWLGLEVVGFLEPKPGIPPNPSHVARTLALGKEKKVKALLQEDYYPETTSKLVASKIPTALVRVPGGTNVNKGQTYLEHMEKMVTMLEKALKGGT